MQLTQILEENGFTHKEAKIYLATLELGNAPASSIARHCGENRVTVYTILKDLCKQGIATETIKGKVKYYTVMEPQNLIKRQKDKASKFEQALPEFLAITNIHKNKPKVYFYDGFEQLKKLFYEIILTDEVHLSVPFLTFLGTDDMDPKFDKFLKEEFIPWRVKNPRKTKSIITRHDGTYTEYTRKQHDTLVIDDSLFDMGNEIVLYGQSKVAILLYSSKEMSGFVIESQTLFNGLKNIFNLLWKTYKKA